MSLKRETLFFYFVLFLFAAVVFIANSKHLSQQGTYTKIYLVLAQNILSYKEYVLNGEMALYPIWGYPLLVTLGLLTGNPDLFLLVVQYFLSIAGTFFFYKMFELEKRIWHIPLLLPFFAVMSVKWPDAIVAFGLVMYIYFAIMYLNKSRKSFLLLPGLTLGLISNFRSEYIYLPLVQLVMVFLPHFKGIKKKFLVLTAVTFFTMLACLLPWAWHSYKYDSQLRFASTNGGGVLYITLGQLPNNPWGIIHKDEYAFRYARSKGEDNPYSAEGDKLLKQEFVRLVREHPVSYLKKVGYNFLSSLRHGVYIGEYTTLAMLDKRRLEIENKLSSFNGKFEKIKSITSLELNESMAFLVDRIINKIFKLVFFFLIVLFIYFSIAYRSEKNSYLVGMLVSIVLYRFSLVSLIQYEPRHMNSIYLLFCGTGIWVIRSVEQYIPAFLSRTKRFVFGNRIQLK